MLKRYNNTGVKVLTGVTFLLMVGANALANILPINGVNTGQISDSFENLFAPAGLTFAIWGVIYTLLAGYTLYQVGLFRSSKKQLNERLLDSVGILFSISSIANTVWIFSWHYYFIPLSLVFMAVILVCLILINRLILTAQLSNREKFFVRLPFSVYFGWITVATIANVTVFLVSAGWDGFQLSDTFWTIGILLTGMCIGTATMLKNRDAAYGLVLIWAYTGILMKHMSENGFDSGYPSVIITTGICLAVFLAGEAVILFYLGKRR